MSRMVKMSRFVDLSRIEVYTFGCCASVMLQGDHNGEKVPYYENYANEWDIVTYLGVLSTAPYVKPSGRLFLNQRIGHLLGAHYLPDFLNKKFIEKDWNGQELEGGEEGRLQGYVKRREVGGYLRPVETYEPRNQYVALVIGVITIIALVLYLVFSGVFCAFCQVGNVVAFVYMLLPIPPMISLSIFS